MVRELVRRLTGRPSPNSEAIARLEGEVKILNVRLAAAREREKFNDDYMSGVDFIGGPEGGTFRYERNQALRGKSRWDVLAKMEADPHVAGAIRGILLPLMGATWEVEAASDKPEDVEIKEFVESNLLRCSSEKFGREYWCASPWRAQRLPEILDFLVSGYSMFAKTWRPVEGKGGAKQVYDRLVWLEPSSVDPMGWELDGDRLVSVKRTYRTPDGGIRFLEPIASEDLALYPWSFKGSRFEGSPFVRPMYGAWYRKDYLLRQAMIWAQKSGAPAPFGVYPSTWDDADIQRFVLFLQQMRGTAPVEAYGAFPQSTDGKEPTVKYAGLEGAQQVDRMRTMIDGENAEIAHGGGTKSQLAGETSTGSRAVAGVQQNFELLLVQAVAEVVCEWETHGVSAMAGLIEDLVDRNYPDVRAYPVLKVSKIEPQADLATLDQLIKAKAAGLVPDHPELRRQVTERLGYTLPDEAYEQQPALVGPDGRPAVGTDGRPLPDKEAMAAEADKAEGGPKPKPSGGDAGRSSDAGSKVAKLSVALASKGYGREPTPFEERVCALGSITAALDSSATGAGSSLRAAKALMVQDIAARGRAGKITAGTLDGLRRSRPKGEAAMKGRMTDQLAVAASRGREQASAELKRQAGMAGVSPQARGLAMGSEDQPRDDHGRWTSGGEGDTYQGEIRRGDRVAFPGREGLDRGRVIQARGDKARVLREGGGLQPYADVERGGIREHVRGTGPEDAGTKNVNDVIYQGATREAREQSEAEIKDSIKTATRSLKQAGYSKEGARENRSTGSERMGRSLAYSGGTKAWSETWTKADGSKAEFSLRQPKYGDATVSVRHFLPDGSYKMGADDQPRDDHGRWTDGGGGAQVDEAVLKSAQKFNAMFGGANVEIEPHGNEWRVMKRTGVSPASGTIARGFKSREAAVKWVDDTKGLQRNKGTGPAVDEHADELDDVDLGSDDQPRDDHGRWTDGGGGQDSSSETPRQRYLREQEQEVLGKQSAVEELIGKGTVDIDRSRGGDTQLLMRSKGAADRLIDKADKVHVKYDYEQWADVKGSPAAGWEAKVTHETDDGREVTHWVRVETDDITGVMVGGHRYTFGHGWGSQRGRLLSCAGPVDGIRLEALPPGGKPPRGVRSPVLGVQVDSLLSELADEARLTASVAVDDLWARMIAEAIGEYQRLSRSGVQGEELWSQLEAHLQSLSDAPIDAAGRRAANVAYNEGRDLAAKEAASRGDAVWAMRSEVLDRDTCERCAALDGTMALIGSDEYDRLMPPAQCLGDENCRGFIIPLADEVTDAMGEEDF